MSKPLGKPAYGSIAHLPGSKEGAGDKRITEGQANICWKKSRDKHDVVVVQEKLDGSCVSAARIDGKILAITRAGYLANTSPFLQHLYFDNWVKKNEGLFLETLKDGERVVGEWISQAHGTKYKTVTPFIAFDIMTGSNRAPIEDDRLRAFTTPYCWSRGPAFPLDEMLKVHRISHHGAEVAEGVVYRVYRKGVFDFAAKYIRSDFTPGKYLEGITGHEDVWNWTPTPNPQAEEAE